MTDLEKAQVLVDGLAHQMIQAGYAASDIAGAMLARAHQIAVETEGPEGWARALERASAVTRAAMIDPGDEVH